MTLDDDFPPPPQNVRDAPVSAGVADYLESYFASPEFAAVKRDHVVNRAFAVLNGLAKHDAEAVGWACYGWLQVNEAGFPLVPLADGRAREEARFWAETAQPHELECYALAAMDRLGGMSGGSALFASRQIKRLAGALFRRMHPDEQAAFKKWIEGQTE